MCSDDNGFGLEIKHRKKTWKFPEHLEVEHFLSISWVKVIKEFLKKHVKPNKNSIYQNMCGTVKAVLRGKFIVPNVYIRRFKKLKNDSYKLYSRNHKEQIPSQAEVLIKIRAEINEIEYR